MFHPKTDFCQRQKHPGPQARPAKMERAHPWGGSSAHTQRTSNAGQPRDTRPPLSCSSCPRGTQLTTRRVSTSHGRLSLLRANWSQRRSTAWSQALPTPVCTLRFQLPWSYPEGCRAPLPILGKGPRWVSKTHVKAVTEGLPPKKKFHFHKIAFQKFLFSFP